MSEDIVARLRAILNHDRAVELTSREAADEIERLRAERDNARWRLCKVVGDQRGVWCDEIAKEYGWDYLNKGDR